MMSSSSSNNSVQRRQIMQPWPLCLLSFSKNKDRPILPDFYSRAQSFGISLTSSSLVSDCASNATIATTTSPFNSQQALITVKKNNGKSSAGNGKNLTSHDNPMNGHYYAENLRQTRQNNLHQPKIYLNPLSDDNDLEDYKQLTPLMRNRDASEMENEMSNRMENQLFLPDDSHSINVGRGKRPIIAQFRKEPTQQRSSVNYLPQVLAALTVSLGSMVVGMASSYTSPALPSMRKNETSLFAVSDEDESWIGSIMPLSAMIGGISGGPCIEYLGRRNTILGTAFPFIGAWLLIALASDVGMVLVGRALQGFCVGVASLSLPVYLGETIQPEVRGTLGLLPTAFGNIGILMCFSAGMYLSWSHLALAASCAVVPFMLLMFLIPETPRWYISKGKGKSARKALQWLRGKNADVTEELAAVEKTNADSEKNATQGALFELFTKNNIKPFAISIGLMFFQQMSGINAVIFYTVQIFQSAGSTLDEYVCSIIIAIVNFAATFVATTLIDRLGRKILLYVSSVTMMITLLTLGGFFYVKSTGADMSSVGALPLVSLVIYVLGFSLGFGPIPWLMMGEILPSKIRGSAASVVTAFNWLCTFIVTKTFQEIIGAIGESGTFWMFGVVCGVGLVFTIIFVPETRGHSLEEIEKRLTGPVRRMSAVANMKPMPTAC